MALNAKRLTPEEKAAREEAARVRRYGDPTDKVKTKDKDGNVIYRDLTWEEHMKRKRRGWESYAKKVLEKEDGQKRANATWQAIRRIRTESAFDYNSRQRMIALESPASTGKVTRKLAARRDAWGCACEEAAAWINEQGGVKPEDIPLEYWAPLHPNCDCVDIPIMRSLEEVHDEIFDKYFGDDAKDIPFEDIVDDTDYSEGILINPKPDDFSYRIDYGRSVDNPLSTAIQRSPDYFALTLKEANKRELEALGELTHKTGHEYMSIMTADKKVVATLEGSTNRIELDDLVINTLKNSPPNSISINQTHTSRTGFSPGDLWELSKYISIAYFRLTTTDGKKYSANVGSGKRPEKSEYLDVKSKIEKRLIDTPRYAKLKEVVTRKRALEKSDEVLFERFVRERNNEIQKAFGWYVEENVKNAEQD